MKANGHFVADEPPPLTCIMEYRLGPHHWARFDAAGALGPILGLEVSAETRDYAWDKVSGEGCFRRLTLFPEGDSRTAPGSEVIRRLRAALDQHQPEAVAILGWSEKSALGALDWCVKNQVPAVLLSDSTAISNPRPWWREVLKRRLVRLCRAALVAGKPQADYLADLGFVRERIFTGWDVVDNHYFAARADAARREAKTLRRRLGLPENYFLAVNRFVEVKNLPRLLQAYAEYRATAGSKAWKLVLVGDGPLKPRILQLREELALGDDLILPGFRQYPELPTFYGLARAFLLASTCETWGLVVNEAMASGLPVLVSDRCGCAVDLVDPRRNGFTFDPQDVPAFAALMLRLASDEKRLTALGQASREMIEQWSLQTFASNLHRAVQAARTVPESNATLLDRLLLWALTRR
jgi:glycosyltransferase involved in cell wall biosynthesis